MKTFDLPDRQKRLVRKAIRLEVISIIVLAFTILGMYLALGNSQAMKTAWFEDMLSLIPPVLFLISRFWVDKKPNPTFPYGYRHISRITFFGAALALTVLGAILLGENAYKLYLQEKPVIEDVEFLGHMVWQGWLMIGMLGLSAVGPVILGHMKYKIAEELHEKTLFADGKMNKADWLTALGAIVGILGIRYGFWWADAVAAILISIDILKDGIENLKNSIEDLMDRRPWRVNQKSAIGIEQLIEGKLNKLEWITNSMVRLREDGQTFNGEVFVDTHDQNLTKPRIQEALVIVRSTDWRLHDISITLKS